jgi:hypothetical protein
VNGRAGDVIEVTRLTFQNFISEPGEKHERRNRRRQSEQQRHAKKLQ